MFREFVLEILIAMFRQAKTEQIDCRPVCIPIHDSCHLNCVVVQFHSEFVVAIPDPLSQRLFSWYGYMRRLDGVAKYRGMTLEYDGTIMLMVLRQVPRFLSAIGAPEADFFAAIGHKMCCLNRTDAS